MMFLNKLQFRLVLLLLGTVALGPTAIADDSADADELTRMLHEFLAGAGDAAAHERFWAEDLVYTSSNGTRTSKAEIMQGFSETADNEGEEPGPVYTAENIRIRVYGTTAVVAFRLVATPAAESAQSGTNSVVQRYLNTGTFVRRDGRWQVVAWQATKIPGS
jgi:ketosteroid isomerase-like protein